MLFRYIITGISYRIRRKSDKPTDMKEYAKKIIRFVAALLISAVITMAAASGILDSADGVISDALYHRPQMTDGEIVVVGMDQRAVEALGQMPWPRSYMAQAIRFLNSDPENRPAVIGLDVLYGGASENADEDADLVAAAREGGNVIVASAATFGSELVTEDDGFHINDRAVLAWDSPYDALAEVTGTGHINAMKDADGIIRHALFSVDVPDIGKVKSFARALYLRYAKYHGLTVCEEPETSSDGFFYLPYSAVPGSYYEDISFIDLIEENIDPQYFSGKIVLIGPYAAGMQDEYYTSIDHTSPMYGIEIQANQIDAYRRGLLPTEAPEYIQLGILFLCCMASILWFRNRRMLLATSVWLCICTLWVGACVLMYRFGVVLHVFWLPVAVTLLHIGTMGANYVTALRDKHRITTTFGRYVDPAILKELLAQNDSADALGGKMYEIAVLFVDIRGFTTMSESLEPPVVVDILNRYLSLTTDCIMRYHGTLDKFVGDCTMAFWNAPLPQEDAVYLACCAAMDMVEGSRTLGQELSEKYGRTVSFGVGVHVGPAVVGNIGASKRMDYTAIGDTVNTASRLESNAPGGKIFISRAVADILGDRAETTSLGGSIHLKGKAEGFETLTLDALKRDAERGSAADSRKPVTQK